MYQYITLRYYHPGLGVGMLDIKNVWLVQNKPVKLTPALHRRSLVYRLPKQGKRISYRQLKKGLLKKDVQIAVPWSLL